MTNNQKIVIDSMNEYTLRKQHSFLSMDRERNAKLLEYIDSKLEHLNVDSAMVQQTDMSDVG